MEESPWSGRHSTEQVTARQSKGRMQILSDDPGKETKHQGHAKYQGS